MLCFIKPVIFLKVDYGNHITVIKCKPTHPGTTSHEMRLGNVPSLNGSFCIVQHVNDIRQDESLIKTYSVVKAGRQADRHPIKRDRQVGAGKRV